MVTRPALRDLRIFNANPTPHNATLLVSIPVLYHVLRHEDDRNSGKYPVALLKLCTWIQDRATAVLKELIVHGVPPVKADLSRDDEWRKVRSLLPIKFG
jgi:hypothetical protein